MPRSIGPVRVTKRGTVIELYFPPLRAAGSALMLALFGVACCVIGGTAASGLLHSGPSSTANLLAFAFAGVFALPLVGLGLWFITIAIWTAANSLTVEISTAGLRTERRCLGYSFARRELRRDDIATIDARLAAKYIGVFDAVRYYRLFAQGRDRALLIADSLKGPGVADNVRNMIVEQLGIPELAAANNKIPVAGGLET